MWCYTEDLQTTNTIIHTLETRLAALTKDHSMEMENSTHKVCKPCAGWHSIWLKQSRACTVKICTKT